MSKKEKFINVRADDEFDAWARDAADELSMSLSDFIRTSALAGYPQLKHIPGNRRLQPKDITPDE